MSCVLSLSAGLWEGADERKQVVISPRNYFLFTPLLPSVTVGTLAARSILEPTRFLTRHLKRQVEVYEGEVSEVDPVKKTVRFVGESLSPFAGMEESKLIGVLQTLQISRERCRGPRSRTIT